MPLSGALQAALLPFVLALAAQAAGNGGDEDFVLQSQDVSRPTTSGRKNILFLMCDSMDGRVLDPTSDVHKSVEMPNLRRLAQAGVNFVRTYAASPQCVPSRTTMFTGRHTHQIKAWSNEQGLVAVPSTGELDKGCVEDYGKEKCNAWKVEQNVTATLVDTLRSLQYEPHLYGKVDVGAGILADGDETNATCDGFHSGANLAIVTRSADIRKATKKDPVAMTHDEDDHVHPEDWKTIGKCIDFLQNPQQQQHRLDSGTAGWMLYCSLNIPHPPFNTNDTWLAYVNKDNVKMPNWPDRSEFHPYDSYMSQSKNVWRDFTEEEILKVRTTYYAMCAETDYMMGLVLAALQRSGETENTYIIFLSDHGEMNMEHRQIWKNSMYEASSRVPMIVAGPGIRKGVVVENLTSLLDVYPTLVEMAGGTPPAFLSGHSLFPLMTDNSEVSGNYPENRCVVSQYHSNMGNTGSFMLRCDRWKYIAFGKALPAFAQYKPQLFDLGSDPEELHDVASQRPDVVQRMDAVLRGVVDYPAVDWEAKVNDMAVFRSYFWEAERSQKIWKHLENAYEGFDQADWMKLKAWVKEAPSSADEAAYV